MFKKNKKSFIPKVEEYGIKGPIINPVRPPMLTLAHPPEEYDGVNPKKKD